MGYVRIALIAMGMVAFVSQFSRIFSMNTHMVDQSVLLVTAHPDDETMFFGPTIRHVVKNNNDLHFLVLSTGNADGIGAVREQEMKAVAPLLGSKEENVVVIDDPQLQDGDENWDPRVISRYVKDALESTKAATVITFDGEGVSDHPNHKAVYEGTLLAARNVAASDKADLTMLSLYSVPLWRKYLFTLDTIVSRTITIPRITYVLISGSPDYSVVRRALTQAHKSQMVWFRYLWAMFSRYMIVNDLCEVDLGRGMHAKALKSAAAATSAEKTIQPRGSNIQTAVVRPSNVNVKDITATVKKPVTRSKVAAEDITVTV